MFRSWRNRLRELGQEAKRAAQWSVSEAKANSTGPVNVRNVLSRWEHVGQRLATFGERFQRLSFAGATLYQMLHDWVGFETSIERILRSMQEFMANWRDAVPSSPFVTEPGTSASNMEPDATRRALWAQWNECQLDLEERVLRVTEKRLRLRVQQPLAMALNEGQALLEGVLGLVEEIQQAQASLRQLSMQSGAYGYVGSVEEVYNSVMGPLLGKCEETCVHLEAWILARSELLPSCLTELLEIQRQFYAAASFVVTEQHRLHGDDSSKKAATRNRPNRRLDSCENPAGAGTGAGTGADGGAPSNEAALGQSALQRLSTRKQMERSTATKPETLWQTLHEKWRPTPTTGASELDASSLDTAFERGLAVMTDAGASTAAAPVADVVSSRGNARAGSLSSPPSTSTWPAGHCAEDQTCTARPNAPKGPLEDQLVDIEEESEDVSQSAPAQATAHHAPAGTPAEAPALHPASSSNAVSVAAATAMDSGAQEASPWDEVNEVVDDPQRVRASNAATTEQFLQATRRSNGNSTGSSSSSSSSSTTAERRKHAIRSTPTAHEARERYTADSSSVTIETETSTGYREVTSGTRETLEPQDGTATPEVIFVVEQRISEWTRNGSRAHNIRALLSTLHEILGEDSGWERLTVQALLDEQQVKVAYRRALLLTHPDRGAANDIRRPAERLLRERVFETLRAAYKSNSIS